MVLKFSVPIFFLLFIFSTSFLYVSCKKDDGTPSSIPPESSSGSSSSPTFTEVYSILDQAKCFPSSTCHQSTFPQMGNKDTAYSNLVGKTSLRCNGRTLVVAGDVNSSYLIDKLTKSGSSLCQGDRMPQDNQTYFDTNVSKLNTIKDWITAGAKND